MKKFSSNFAIMSILAFIGITACSKNETTPAVTVVSDSVKNLVADPAVIGDHFALYSLERNELVSIADSATAKWDIGFRTTTIIINGGTSGPSNGGAFVQRSTTFENYTAVANDSVFRTDNNAVSPTAYAIPIGSGNGWYLYNFITNVVTPIPGNLLIIRTASGKYAKVEILSYYKDAPAVPDAATDIPRYYTFRFSYQANGSKEF